MAVVTKLENKRRDAKKTPGRRTTGAGTRSRRICRLKTTENERNPRIDLDHRNEKVIVLTLFFLTLVKEIFNGLRIEMMRKKKSVRFL